jgi:hypothetical protein
MRIFALLFLLLAMPIVAADPAPTPPPAPPPKVDPAIRFPDITPPPSPAPPSPAPNPTAPIPLNGDEVYAFDADIETMVKGYQPGLLKIDVQPGPARIKAKWAGSDGKSSWKEFKGKFVTTVESAGSGTATLVIVPVGAKSTAEWIEKGIAANVAPQPPPVPPGPKPPEPKPPGPVSSFHVIFIHESGATIPQEQVAVMDAQAVRDWLMANTTPENGKVGWRRKDKDSGAANDTPTMKALWEAVKPKITTVPAVAVEVNRAVDIIPLEATPETMLAKFKAYKGGN